MSSVDWNTDVIVSGSWEQTIKLWRRDGTLLRTFKGHEGSVTSVKISPNGQFIVSGSSDGTVKIWRLDGKLLNTLRGHTESIVEAVAISPDAKFIVSGSWDKTVKIWRLDGKLLNTLRGHTMLLKQWRLAQTVSLLLLEVRAITSKSGG
ncbi:MAG UNVERIFIED_CONTAM: hypothetical protein LVR29_18545 [Microcystis novacekii LVE1205-3]